MQKMTSFRLRVCACLALGMLLRAAPVSAQMRKVSATLSDAQGSLQRFALQIADTDNTRMTGLMHRRQIDRDGGMLFVFEEAAPRSFWMKDTYVSLDMLFVDANCRVVDIIAQASPHSLQSHASRRAILYVVELAGGQAGKRGLRVGSELRFAGTLLGHSCPRKP